jgi:hypothetical protein
MTLRLELSPETEAALREQAAAEGIELEAIALRELERSAIRKWWADYVASVPVLEETEAELTEFLDGEIRASRAERRGKP